MVLVDGHVVQRWVFKVANKDTFLLPLKIFLLNIQLRILSGCAGHFLQSYHCPQHWKLPKGAVEVGVEATTNTTTKPTTTIPLKSIFFTCVYLLNEKTMHVFLFYF
jgi:hypothetical protein